MSCVACLRTTRKFVPCALCGTRQLCERCFSGAGFGIPCTTDWRWHCRTCRLSGYRPRPQDMICQSCCWPVCKDFYEVVGPRDAASYETLTGMGITAIVNVTSSEPNHFADIPGMDYLRCPVEDALDAPIEKYFDQCSAFIESMRAQGRATLVHCRGGISRRPTMVIAYLMKFRGFSRSDAFNLVAGARRIDPNSAFMAKLARICGL